MDDQQLDAIAKALATDSSRRRVLGTLAAAFAASLLVPLRAQRAVAAAATLTGCRPPVSVFKRNRPDLGKPFRAVSGRDRGPTGCNLSLARSGLAPRVSNGYGNLPTHTDDFFNEYYAVDYAVDPKAGGGSFPVRAAAGGTLRRHDEPGYNGSPAHTLWIKHNDNWQTKYMHLSACGLIGGIGDGQTLPEKVKKGKVIGWAGNSGSDSIHLHFELRGGSTQNFTSFASPTCCELGNCNWSYPVGLGVPTPKRLPDPAPCLLSSGAQATCAANTSDPKPVRARFCCLGNIQPDPCDAVDCSGLPHVRETSCRDRQCVITSCESGFADCDNAPSNGCETELGTLIHCRGCNDACGTTNPCAVGLCDPANGCFESPVLDDTACAVDGQSGFCLDGICQVDACAGIDCTRLPHVRTANCRDGRCVIAECEPGFADCDGDPTNGCEVDSTFAATTPFRSARIVTTYGEPEYTNLSNCSATDGLTCDRPTSPGFGNLYFRDFADFGMPKGSKVTGVKIRVTGKSSHGYYVGLSAGTEFTDNCQFPSDLWATYASQTIITHNFSAPVVDIFQPGAVKSSCLTENIIETSNFIWRINYATGQSWSANIDNFEIAFDYDPPQPPEPFLDLPWDYSGKGLSFNEAALSINSFFDHEYPLLSSGLTETSDAQLIVRGYDGQSPPRRQYTRHDGYDYGRIAKANNGDPVLAAAPGWATYINSCGACGNAIHIDHENGYQTRYYHLQADALITNVPGQRVHVDAGQQVGRVGATGNVWPQGEEGAHIHFMVIQDKNSDGNFEDNIPDGVTDPFGWQSTEPDPWENYTFSQNDVNKNGNKSFYLWSEKLDGLKADLPANGGVFNTGRYSVIFPQGATDKNLLLEMLASPMQRLSDFIVSIGSTMQIIAKDPLGNPTINFSKPFIVEIDFAGYDLSRFLINTLSIYSTNDGITWQKEETSVDLLNKKATTEVEHLTYFALMAERADTIAPTTTAMLTGDQGESGWFRSDVSLSLNAIDNPGGLGVDYTLYRKEGEDWQEYIAPLQFTEEGTYTVEFYSVDNDENIEEKKSVEFSIDKTPPEAEIHYSLQTKRIEIAGKDGSDSATLTQSNNGSDKKIVVADKAGNTVTILAKSYISRLTSWISIQSLQYNTDDAVVLEKNNFLTTPLYNYRNYRTNQLSSIGQVYSVKDKNILGILYTVATDKTKIYIYDSLNRQLLKEEQAGMHLLQLTTENATLKYSY